MWGRIWAVLSETFIAVGTAPNLAVAMYAVDSLRQLAMKFLERDELAGYTFQNDFLRPFVVVMRQSGAVEIRELIIRCLSQMVLARVNNVKSGWKVCVVDCFFFWGGGCFCWLRVFVVLYSFRLFAVVSRCLKPPPPPHTHTHTHTHTPPPKKKTQRKRTKTHQNKHQNTTPTQTPTQKTEHVHGLHDRRRRRERRHRAPRL